MSRLVNLERKEYMKSFRWIVGAFALFFFSAVTCWGQNVQNVLSNAFEDSVQKEIKTQPPEYDVLHDLPYYSGEGDDSYRDRQCRLDIVFPKNVEQPFSTIVWFHGGGLTGGKKYVPQALKALRRFKEGKMAIVSVGYRLAPTASFPAYLEDVAASVSWVLDNISNYGGDPSQVFISGGSAGAYLATMTSAYPKWLNIYSHDPQEIAGVIAVSGQMTTHFHVKEELSYKGDQYVPFIDDKAPLGGVSSSFPPIFFLLGDRKLEWKCRVEENELMAASLRALGAKKVVFLECPGYSHQISEMGNNITEEIVDAIDLFIDDVIEIQESAKRP